MTAALAIHTGSIDNDWRRRRLVLRNRESLGGLHNPSVIPVESGRTQTAVFETAAPSDWLFPVLQRIDELLNLPSNWDHQGAQEVRSDAVTFTLHLLSGIMLQATPAPQILPVSSGGLQLEWHEKRIDLEIEIEAPNQVYVSFEDAISGEMFDKELSTDFTVLTDPVRRLTER